jgi:protein-cysteine N-palmitoyltransferase HHAT
MDTDLPESHYDFLHYITYVFYAPVFIGGPILSFNAFASQLHKPMKSFKPMEVVWMLVRLALWSLALEVAIHFVYFDGINDQELWINDPTYPSWAIAFGGFFTLHFMWTKFMTIWRFFRVWAIIDGIECQENMLRWIHNNCTFTGFWKGWHASLNKWIVRYLFVPLGGSKTQTWNMWVIFTFIGLWHDLWWRWVAWAWITCFCFCGEIAVIRFFGSKRRFGWFHATWYWSVLKVVVTGFNMALICISNLAIPHGFVGIYHFVKRSYFGRDGVIVFAGCIFYASAAHLVQMRQREDEERRRLEKQS